MVATKNTAVHNKKTGALFEGAVRSALKSTGQFIYVKGVSSKGIDIFALKNDIVMFLELKSHKQITNTLKKDAFNQFIINDVIVDDFINKTYYEPKKVLYCLIMYERNIGLTQYHTNGDVNYYVKNSSSINNLLLDTIEKEITHYDDI